MSSVGAMLVRSSPAMILFYKKWLFEMVQGGESTDQKLLMKLFSEFATQSFDCNPPAKEIFAFTEEDKALYNYTGRISNNISFCFLNEVLFQVKFSLHIVRITILDLQILFVFGVY